MEHVDALMLSPATPSAPRDARVAQPQQQRQVDQTPDALDACALTPRTIATICQLVPRQDPHVFAFEPPSWLATQAWQYFDDSGFERSTTPGVAGRELRTQRKCRCLYCDDLVTATPTTMAKHIVSTCRIADGTAKRALRTGKADLLTTLAVAPVSAKPRRPEALELVVASSDASSGRVCSSFASPSYDAPPRRRTSTAVATCTAHPRTLDYVSAFAWEVNELRKRSRSCVAGTTEASERLDDAVKHAEALINASVGAKSSAAGAHNDKENEPPHGRSGRSDHDAAGVKVSAAKRPRLSVRSLNVPKPTTRKPQLPKKRLFDPPPSEPTQPTRCSFDVSALVRDLVKACVAECVPLAFLSSASFIHAIQSASASAFEPAIIQKHAVAALEELATPVDSVCDAMRASPSTALTFVVQRMTLRETRRALVYLVDASGASAFVSCQQADRAICDDNADFATALWLHEVQEHFAKVSEWCGQPLHVCVVDYPRALERQLLQTLALSHTTARLAGSCMAQAFKRVARDAMALLYRAPDVVQSCAELALLVNEVEQQQRHANAQPTSFVLLTPRGESVVSFAVLLAQVQRLHERTATMYESSRGMNHARSEQLHRVNELLQTQRTEVPAMLAILRPLAVAELLLLLQTRASASVKLTSGAFVCLELWLFASIDQSQLMTTSELRTWRDQFLQRLNATRMDHELACLLLDPRLAGAGLNAAGRDAARASVLAVAERARPDASLCSLETQLTSYVNRTGVFSRDELWKQQSTADPNAFWRSVEHAHELQSVALLVCSYAPCSPSDRAVVLDSGADMDQATRAAQVRHHLARHDVLRDPATLSMRSALELLQFLLCDDSTRQTLESRELEASAWRPINARALPPRAEIQSSSRQFADALRAAINSARATAAPVEDAPALPHLLLRFSCDWIDCSAAGRAAMRRAIAALSAPATSS